MAADSSVGRVRPSIKLAISRRLNNADDHGKFLVPVSKEAGVPSVNKLLYPLHSIRDIVAAGVVHAAATNFYSYE